MMHDWWWGGGAGGWSTVWFGPLFMIGLLVLIGALIVAVVRSFGSGSTETRASVRTAREILDERFAKGEIEREEYEQRRKAIET